MPALKKALQAIGLGDKQTTVLMVLLEHGPLLVAAVAKYAKLNRTTTYGLLRELSTKGLVSQVKKEGADRWQSIAPDMLPAYIEKRRDDLSQVKHDVEELVPQIKLMRTKGNVLPKVQFFEGKEGVEQAYYDMVEHNEGKMIYALTGLEGAVSSLGNTFMERFIATRMRQGIHAEYIVPETDVAREATLDDLKKGRAAKFIPPEFNFNMEICVYDNRVSLLSYAQENPIALIIEDNTIAHAMKQIFRFVQKSAK
ncbi:MAG TPA: helix-turn-helix domain-containing protein [Candidatus Paceibacterota bacterium]|jgi:sugar-specific transcriptional regulator TrmB|nr:helix-turn-helix domain-containing protein [Candidatus Paceibacterota bacterium]